MRIEYMALADLKRAPRNPKSHKLEEIVRSFGRFGFVMPVLLNETTGTILAGHGRVEGLSEQKANGEEPPERIVARDDDWFLPVIRGVAFEDDADAEAYLIADNRIGELGGWKDAELAPMLEELAAKDRLAGTGYQQDDVRALLEKLSTNKRKGRTDADSIPEQPAEPVTKTGDLWKLGPHRVLCGDATKEPDVRRLVEAIGGDVHMVLTDPPFAIYGSSTGIGADIADDKMVRPFFEAMFRQIAGVLPWFAHVYVHCDWRSWSALWDAASRAAITPKNCIVWDKGSAGLGSSYANTYEFVGFFAKLPPEGAMRSSARTGQRQVHRPNLMRFDRVRGAERQHNAAKPVALLEELIHNSTDDGEGHVVLDLFGGSGSTLIAAEKQQRRCAMMDSEPKWCDVIVRRWEEFTGRKATKA